MRNRKKAPEHLKHKPIVTVDYEKKDAYAGDAKFLSLGQAQWNPEDYSAKVWRKTNEHWSRQSEELPLWRVLDLATLLVATINGKESDLEEFVQDVKGLDNLKDYLQENMELFAPKIAELKSLMESKTQSELSEDAPNLFDFATSELSQDALFAWLMQWADPKYKEQDATLHSLAQEFVKLLVGDEKLIINSISVGRQWRNIDIWAEINDNAFLVVEDKTNTTIHDNQLKRYKRIVESEYKGSRKTYFSYVKTGNEPLSRLKEIKKDEYNTIARIDIIHCLEKYSGNNSIVIDYLKRLKDIEKETQSFEKLPVSIWSWYAWKGFYSKLDKKIGLTSWDYVSNPSGGFLGAWWHFKQIHGINGAKMYLQFEEQRLCFKVSYSREENRSEFRQFIYEKLKSVSRQMNHPEITRPERFGAGCYMTIATVKPCYLFGDGIVDFEYLFLKINEYQHIVDMCCNAKNE